MEEYTQGIPPVRTMPQAQAPAAAPTNRKKKIIIAIVIAALLLGGFSAYWFYFRDTAITEQDKLDILDELTQSSTIDFTPEAKEAILTGLTAQSEAGNPTAADMSEEDKMAILNSLGGAK